MLLSEQLLTPEEVAKLLKINKRTVYYWIEKRLINYIRINHKVVRFRLTDVEELIQKHTVRASDVDEVVDEIFAKLS